MNSFFGNVQAPVDGNFDTAIQNIPADTKVNALIEESKWETFTPDSGENAGIEQTFIKNTWTIVDGEYQNRKIFQKLHVMEANQGKKERALKMFAAIDANCGGKIMASGVMPDAMMLSVSLCNVPMTLTLGEWSIGGASGNHVTAISRLQAPVLSQGQAINQAVAQVQTAAPQPQQAPVYNQQPQMAPQATQQQDVNAMQPQNMSAEQLAASDVQQPAVTQNAKPAMPAF